MGGDEPPRPALLPPRHEQGAGVYGAVLRRAQFRAGLSRTGWRYGQPLSVTYARATGAGSFPFPDFILPLQVTDAPRKNPDRFGFAAALYYLCIG